MSVAGKKESEATAKGKSITVSELEQLLTDLRGIRSARVVVNEWGGIEEIHVLAGTERNPKQLVRDVESALAARWGVEVDHKKVSIAQLKDDDSDVPASSTLRLRLVSLEVLHQTLTGKMTVNVVLDDGDGHEFSGEASGPLRGRGIYRLPARAAAAAVDSALGGAHSLHMEECHPMDMNGHELIVALMRLIAPQGEDETLVGAVLSRDDPIRSAVGAVLDAVNRRFGAVYSRPD